MVTGECNAQIRKISASGACLDGSFALSAKRTDNAIGFSSFVQIIGYFCLI